MTDLFDDCLIMAGGSGTRLWPASSSRLPKQFLPIPGGGSFFSTSVDRALAVTGEKGRVIIIAGNSHIHHVVKDIAKLNAKDKKRLIIINEPAGKNTAPAIACAIVYSLLDKKNRKMLVLTSDHIIEPLEKFTDDAALAASAAAQGKFVIFGIQPSRPETGYGYIEIDKGKPLQGVYKVSAFHEKPDLQTAKKYTASKSFFWNSGMFAFSTEFMADEFRRFAPEVMKPFEKLKLPETSSFTVSRGVRILNAWLGLENAYRKTTSISFDYAIAEKCSETVMVRSGFNWLDIGNWDEYVKVYSKNNSKVFIASEDKITGDSCYVDSDIPVALAGVEDLIVVIRSGKDGVPAAALITKKGQTQKVRHVVEQIKKEGSLELL